MTKQEKDFTAWCAENDPVKFYKWRRWRQVRKEVLRMDRYECQLCRTKYHRYRKATTVHHVNHFKDRPELGLEIWYYDPAQHKKRRNLLSLCHDCHEEVHNYRQGDCEYKAPLTEERWD